MTLKKEEYIPRLVDKKIEDYLSVFGAVSIEGPKWCGKTWTSLTHAKSMVSLDDEETKEKAELSLEYIMDGQKPLLIDEWNLVPKIWDAVRRDCDNVSSKGNYILTCSTKLSDAKEKEKIHHSGAGRIGKIQMYPMSLYESSNSSGEASIMDMYNGTLKNKRVPLVSLKELADFIIRGGWPSNLKTPIEKAGIIPREYVKSLLDKDINDEKKRDKSKMLMLLKSLARNEATVVGNQTLIKDIAMYEEDKNLLENRKTVEDYLDVLSRLHLVLNQDAYSENYRSRVRVGKSPKRHFVDPSLACAVLGLTQDKLISDLKTFGFMFESLVERDLRIYMDYLNGNLYHFRDNVSGLEVDSILEFEDGEYGAIEIKLGFNGVDEAKKSLMNFYKCMDKKPKFMCVIAGYCDIIAKDPETGIYIVPITALKY